MGVFPREVAWFRLSNHTPCSATRRISGATGAAGGAAQRKTAWVSKAEEAPEELEAKQEFLTITKRQKMDLSFLRTTEGLIEVGRIVSDSDFSELTRFFAVLRLNYWRGGKCQNSNFTCQNFQKSKLTEEFRQVWKQFLYKRDLSFKSTFLTLFWSFWDLFEN